MLGSIETWSATLVGKTLAGRYRVTELLGAGGVGAVFLAQHVAVGRRVALKVLHPEFHAHGSVVDRFHREARAAAACAREGVVDVLDLDRDPACGPFLVMEYLEGETLSARLKARAPLPIDETLRIVRALVGTLAVVHARGIVHRDLKPANVMLAMTPEGREVVKVLDFGLAREMTSTKAGAITLPGSVLGTPRFMAPEQAAGDPSVDARADIYAVGAILYCCLGARPPYSDVPPEEALHAVLLRPPTSLDKIRPDLAPPVLAVVAKAMARDRKDRFQDVASLRAELELALAGFDDASTLVESSGPVVRPSGVALHVDAMDSTPQAVMSGAVPVAIGVAPGDPPPSTMSYPPFQRPIERGVPTTNAQPPTSTDPLPPHRAIASTPTIGTVDARGSHGGSSGSSRSDPRPLAPLLEPSSPRGSGGGGGDAAAMESHASAATSPGASESQRSRSDLWWILPTVLVGLVVVVGLPAYFVLRVAGVVTLGGGGGPPSAAADPTSGWPQQRIGRFVLSVPMGWQPIATGDPSVVGALAGPTSSSPVRAQVAVSREAFAGTTAEYVGVMLERARASGGVTAARADQSLGGGTWAVRTESVWNRPQAPYRDVAVHVVLEGTGYVVRCTSSVVSMPENDICRSIAGSTRVE